MHSVKCEQKERTTNTILQITIMQTMIKMILKKKMMKIMVKKTNLTKVVMTASTAALTKGRKFKAQNLKDLGQKTEKK